MTLFRNILATIDGWLFCLKFGFSKQRLSALYRCLEHRDDKDYVWVRIDSLDLLIQNTVLLLPDGELLAVQARYEDSRNPKIFCYNYDKKQWKEVLDTQFWRRASRGPWTAVIKTLTQVAE